MIPAGDLRKVDEKLSELGVQSKLRDLVRLHSDSGDARSLMDQIAKFETSRIVQAYKFGVIRWCDGQSEDEAFANDTSPAFEAFLESIGRKIRLKGWNKYRGGLNVTGDETGTHSVFAESNGFDVMFHVSTMLPFNAADKQQLERKRHLGNDVVIVVFREPGSKPFDVSQFRSQFNHVFVVVSVHGAKGYRVGVTSKPGVPFFGPRMPAGGVFAQSPEFADWLLTKLINSERAAMHAKDFQGKLLKTHTAQLNAIVKGMDEMMHRSSVPRISGVASSSPSSSSRFKTRRQKKARAKATVASEAVDPDDPQELRRRLEELKARQKSDESSIDGLKKLASFYSRDPKAQAETEVRLKELEKEQQELASQIASIEGKLGVSRKASALVTDVVLKNKTEAEKRSLLASYHAEMSKQEKAVESLEKLLGFYQKDPAGAEKIRPQVEKERASLDSLRERVAELEQSLQADTPTASVVSSEEQSSEYGDEYDDEYYEEDDFNVDALSAALRDMNGGAEESQVGGEGDFDAGGFDVDALTRALKGAGVDDYTAVAQENAETFEVEAPSELRGLAGLKSTLAELDLGGDNDEYYDYASESATGESDADVVGLMMESYTSDSGITVPAGSRVWVLSTTEDGDWTWISGEAGELYVPSQVCMIQDN